MGCRAWVPSPCALPRLSLFLLLLLLLAPLGAHPQAGRVSTDPTARWPWAAGVGRGSMWRRLAFGGGWHARLAWGTGVLGIQLAGPPAHQHGGHSPPSGL